MQAEAPAEEEEEDVFEACFQELRKWTDPAEGGTALLLAKREARAGRLASAFKCVPPPSLATSFIFSTFPAPYLPPSFILNPLALPPSLLSPSPFPFPSLPPFPLTRQTAASLSCSMRLATTTQILQQIVLRPRR